VLKARILEFDRMIMAWHRSSETSRRLDDCPGVGPALATALVATVADPKAFSPPRIRSRSQARIRQCDGTSGLSRSPNRPALHYVLFALPTSTSRRVTGAISMSLRRKGDRLLVAFTLGHHGPDHSCDLVGKTQVLGLDWARPEAALWPAVM
jgi:transposase